MDQAHCRSFRPDTASDDLPVERGHQQLHCDALTAADMTAITNSATASMNLAHDAVIFVSVATTDTCVESRQDGIPSFSFFHTFAPHLCCKLVENHLFQHIVVVKDEYTDSWLVITPHSFDSVQQSHRYP
eukprot:gene31975-39498_t